ncbi:hypothetical protein KFL_000410110 [Klebsormidium nitens]|uniref:Uncharacterized protein n=1 Tax=Klebsormidium nitens TaxID=105231 RepID=A0A1Y1HQ49_KLENI|nr:hypothetical protein KFL_000410110 [Klebsormidium nitens]|eukprot:GAQ79912.1 hypothetical protein KFL_000410110 [Klebsormidium nitens]
MAQDGAPEARRVGVQVLYRLLQFFAFTILLQFVAGLRHYSLYDLAWVPKGIVTLWRWMWAAVDYVLLDMDWVQPLQRLIVDHIWPLWRDYWILAAVCTVIWERLHPTLQTDYDIYAPPIEDDD